MAGIGASAYGDSFLTAQSFPKTFDDLSFVERVEILREGYAPWESEYDDNGICVKNCTYQGISIAEEQSIIERETEEARHRAELYMIEHGGAQLMPSTVSENAPVNFPQPSVAAYPANTGLWTNDDNADYDPIAIVFPTPEPQPTTYQCEPSNPKIPSNQNIPYGLPLTGNPRVSSPYGNRVNPVTKKPQLHKGIDYAVPKGTIVFSPANGVVDRVFSDNTCGNGLVINHSDGLATLYCHLSSVSVSKGDVVNAGCPVALTGNTGRSTGPHLHYGIYSNKKLIDPTSFTRQ
ncbi:M23 family metallopeptidase [Lachnospiraceae bacterium OttesenSCG-928-E19]|nr:M23 family metallopeptidase [Lachnospiraceae bacterium OttesenSCG-928-E19]